MKKFSSMYEELQEFAGELCKEISASVEANQLKTARKRLDKLIVTFDQLEQQMKQWKNKKQ